MNLAQKLVFAIIRVHGEPHTMQSTQTSIFPELRWWYTRAIIFHHAASLYVVDGDIQLCTTRIEGVLDELADDSIEGRDGR